jgi:hypothetical protein
VDPERIAVLGFRELLENDHFENHDFIHYAQWEHKLNSIKDFDNLLCLKAKSKKNEKPKE